MLGEGIIQESMAGHAARNSELLQELRRKGAKLNMPQSVEHHFWADDQKSAASLARELYRRGFLVLVIAPVVDAEDGEKRIWNVEAGVQRTLTQAADPAITEELVRLAAEFDATYDGWGTNV